MKLSRERTESGDVEYLSFASGEECGTMDSGNEVDFTFDRSDLIEFSAGESDVIGEDAVSDFILDPLVEDIHDLGFIILFAKFSLELFTKFSAARFSGGLGEIGHGNSEFVATMDVMTSLGEDWYIFSYTSRNRT